MFPTPFYRLDRLSEQYGRGIWIKRDDLCGVALGGSKVRKLEFVLAEALDAKYKMSLSFNLIDRYSFPLLSVTL